MTCEYIKDKINMENFIFPYKITFHNKIKINKFKTLFINDYSFNKTIKIYNLDEWKIALVLLEIFIANNIPFMAFDDSGKFILNKNDKYDFNAPLSWGIYDNTFYNHITDEEIDTYNTIDWNNTL